MKKTLLTVIITLLAVAGIILISHAIWGEGECIFGDDDDKKECRDELKSCCDKGTTYDAGCCSKKHTCEGHDGMMESLKTARSEFDGMLSEDEKVTIAAVKEKLGDVDHTKLCGEGMEKYTAEHQADFDALRAIAENHKEYLDGLYAKSHENMEGKCKEHKTDMKDEGEDDDDTAEVEDGETAKKAAEQCPEAKTCKEATEKCKGEMTQEKEEKCKEDVEKKCAEEIKKCEEMEKKCIEKCNDTFRIHFLLLDLEG